MSSFTSPLVVEITQRQKEGRAMVKLLEPFTYAIGSLDSGNHITVPAGFETDFASIPRAFWILEPPMGTAAKAAVLHDYLYVNNIMKRKECDRIFREAMTVLQVSNWKIFFMFQAVRLFGIKGYDKRL